MGKLVKRLIKSQILASNSFVKIRNNNLFSFKTAPDFFSYSSRTTTYTVATGGTVTQIGDYKIHTFNSSSDFVISQLGSNPTVEYLVVAAGGGGGAGYAWGAGAGGGGGLLTGTSNLLLQTYPVVVGSGGLGSTSSSFRGNNGSNSSFNNLTSIGGGGGGTYLSQSPSNGGSGGGASSGQTAGLGTVGQGNNGAISSAGVPYNGGGGGGATQIGNSNGTGGNGLMTLINGNTLYYAGGGGGGASAQNNFAGNGGLGGGGKGGELSNFGLGQNGTSNTGGGGGGAAYNAGPVLSGGNGGSGVVIIKYLSPIIDNPFPIGFGGIVSSLGNYRIHTFNSSDNFVVANLGIAPNNVVEYLIVAGGGGGGSYAAGGGGAGGYLANTGLTIAVQSYAVVVGSGGAGPTSNTDGNTNGNNSSFNSLISIGGGKGSLQATAPSIGGSGGGNKTTPSIAGTAGQGNAGGQQTGGIGGGGGGGGAGAVGSNGVASAGGNGGYGLSNSISGTSIYYAGGGGGAGVSAKGIGGLGGGGNGEDYLLNPASTNGTANTGGGGGGMYLHEVANSSNGGSGIVIIKYKFQDIPFLPTAQTYFDQVATNGGSLTDPERNVINTFIGALGTDFAEFDRLWIHGLSNSIAARTSLANPTSTMVSVVNSPVFTANQGYTGGGGYLNTNYTPSTQGVKFTQNNASLYVYVRNSVVGDHVDIGAISGTNKTFLITRYSNGSAYYPLNFNTGLGSPPISATTSAGLTSSNLNGITLQTYKNGIQMASMTIAPELKNTIPFYILASNSSGTPGSFSTKQISLSAIGSGIINQTTFYNAVQALGTSIGWAV